MGDKLNFLEMTLGGHFRKPRQAKWSRVLPTSARGMGSSNSTPVSSIGLLASSPAQPDELQASLRLQICKAAKLALLDILRTLNTNSRAPVSVCTPMDELFSYFPCMESNKEIGSFSWNINLPYSSMPFLRSVRG